jgi:large subunit ribosomal protein L15
MSTGLHQLVRTGKRPYRRVGRGQSSTRGKQSGRGGKGQTARAGNKRRPEMRDIIKKLPKRRGYGKNRGRSVDGTIPDSIVVSLERLSNMFENGSEVTMKSLAALGVTHVRKMTPVKIVGTGEITKKLTINGIAVSASARAAIEKAGGTVLEFVTPANAQTARIKTSKAANKTAKTEIKKVEKEAKKD